MCIAYWLVTLPLGYWLGIATQQLINVDHAGRIVMLNLPGKIERETAILTRQDNILPATGYDLIDSLALAMTE